MDDCLEKEIASFEEKLGFYFGRLFSYPLVPPEHVYFSPTNRCNLKCKMCAIDKTPDQKKELTISEIKNIIIQIECMGIKHLILSGGEPLLRDDLLEMVEFSIMHNIERVDIITNGILLNDQIIEKLIKVRLNHITFSLDGLKDVNDEIRGEGVFDKAQDNLDRLGYYKSKYRSLYPTVGINFTIMDRNIGDILPIIDFAKYKKCNCIVFQPLLFNNIRMYEKRKNDMWPSQDNIIKLKNNIKKIIALKETLNDFEICTAKEVLEAIPTYFDGKSMGSKFKCYECIKRIVIGYDGRLWSCSGIYGDLKENSLEEVWFSKEAMRIRDIVKQCSKHCLQDCVYSSTDILEDTILLLKKLKYKMIDKKGIKDRLLDKSMYYDSLLKKNDLSPSGHISIDKEKRNLNLIRKKILAIR